MLRSTSLHAYIFRSTYLRFYAMVRFIFIRVYMLGFVFYHVHMLNFYIFTCKFLRLFVSIYVSTSLCAWIYALYMLCASFPCACAFYAMIVCLHLGYVCRAKYYHSPFVTLSFFLVFLAYFFKLDIDPMVFFIVHTPWPISKGLDHSYFACLCLLASML